MLVADDERPFSIAKIMHELTGKAIEPGKSFIENGGHSLMALRVQSRLRDRGVEISLERILRAETLGDILTEKSIHPSKEAATESRSDRYATTPQERSLSLLASLGLNPFEQHYVLIAAIEVGSSHSERAVKDALQDLVQDHPPLHTFLTHDEFGVLVREPLPRTAIEFDYASEPSLAPDLDDEGLASICAPHIEQMVEKGIDIASAPPLKAKFVTGEQRLVVILVLHHSVADASGLNDLIDELRMRLAGTDQAGFAQQIRMAYEMQANRSSLAPPPEAVAYWRALLEGITLPRYIGFKGRAVRGRAHISTARFPGLERNRSAQLARLTPNSVWLALLASIVNYRFLEEPADRLPLPCFSTMSTAGGGAACLGYSLDIVPVVIDFRAARSVLELAAQIQEQIQAWIMGNRCPIADLTAQIAEANHLFTDRRMPLIAFQALHIPNPEQSDGLRQIQLEQIAVVFRPYLPLDALVSINIGATDTIASCAACHSAFSGQRMQALCDAAAQSAHQINLDASRLDLSPRDFVQICLEEGT